MVVLQQYCWPYMQYCTSQDPTTYPGLISFWLPYWEPYENANTAHPDQCKSYLATNLISLIWRSCHIFPNNISLLDSATTSIGFLHIYNIRDLSEHEYSEVLKRHIFKILIHTYGYSSKSLHTQNLNSGHDSIERKLGL